MQIDHDGGSVDGQRDQLGGEGDMEPGTILGKCSVSFGRYNLFCRRHHPERWCESAVSSNARGRPVPRACLPRPLSGLMFPTSPPLSRNCSQISLRKSTSSTSVFIPCSHKAQNRLPLRQNGTYLGTLLLYTAHVTLLTMLYTHRARLVFPIHLVYRCG